MPTLLLHFPGRRYHATPWGHHVNEGLVEWPPSPWRVLRALISVGYTKLGWRQVPPEGRQLLLALAERLPRYRVPLAAAAHSRHYMPVSKLRKDGVENTTLVFDTWAQIEGGALAVSWDVDLSPAASACLVALVEHLGYLGRSESVVVGELLPEGASLPPGLDVLPCDGATRPGRDWAQVPLLAPEQPAEYARWLTEQGGPAEEEPNAEPDAAARPTGRARKKPKKKVTRGAQAEPPPDVIGCLEVETSWLRKHGWNQPPGTRRVLYWRPADALEVGAPVRRSAGATAAPVEAMLLALATPSGNLHALPSIRRTLPQAELLHRALVSHAAAQPCPPAALLGKSRDGAPLVGHRHAHLLPLDLDDDGLIDHVLIWAPMGLDSAAQEAVRSLRRTFTKGGVGELRVALAGAGCLCDLVSSPGRVGDGLRRFVAVAPGARRWVSRTPFVPPRHVKARGTNTLAGQVQSELASRGLPPASEVRILPVGDEGVRSLRHFVKRRQRGEPPPTEVGLALELTLEIPITGPLCLGYASHFGLGQFVTSVDQ